MTGKDDLKDIFEAAVAAVQPDAALLRHLRLNGNVLEAGGKSYDLSKGRVLVIGAGKGAAPMARALENLLGERIDRGFVVVKYGHGLDLERIALAGAAHPTPDQAGEVAANRMLEIAGEAKKEDLLVCLFTGGASALLPAPINGVSLADLRKTTMLLLACGAEIAEINAIRKHLSRLSGGRLAQAANGANALSLIVSDVIGDDFGSIASGPTAPDSSTFGDCLAIIRKYGIAAKLPGAAMEALEAGAAGKLPETPKPGAKFFERVQNIIIASNRQALDAAATKAGELGFAPRIIGEPMRGEARSAACALVRDAEKIAASLAGSAKPACLLAGGETTVTLAGSGLGGRNQEMALAAAIELLDKPRIGCLFAGTDGSDGPTEAAGGFAFADTVEKMGGLAKARQYLADNDSARALAAAGDQFVTGPTRTNVMDIAILLIDPPYSSI